MKKRTTALGTILRIVLLPLFCVLALLLFAFGLQQLDSGHNAEDLQQLEDALRRSCVTCYATEGVYPPDLAYLQEHYGLQIDSSRYTVYYDIFAENLMPDITVLENVP